MKENRDIDPFFDEPEQKTETENQPPPPKARPIRRRLSTARAISFTAMFTAISIVMMVLTCYLPLTIAPLVVISLCYNLAYEKCGIAYGVMCMIASVGLGFLCCSANLGILLIVTIVFVPYSALSLFMKKLDYSTLFKGAIRVIIVASFSALEVLFIYLLSAQVASFIDINGIIAYLRLDLAVGYLVITLIAMAIFVCVDLLFMRLTKEIAKKIK